MSPKAIAGPIREACVVVADLASARSRLAATLGWRQVTEPTGFDPRRARSWGRPGLASAATCTLVPPSGQGGNIRLIQAASDAPARPAPFRRLGWSAIELQVADSAMAVDRARDAGMRVLGTPKKIGDGGRLPILAGQVLDENGMVLYLTQIMDDIPGFDLPHVRGDVDGVFVAVLNVTDLDSTRDAIERRLCVSRVSDRKSPIGVVNESLGLPPDTHHRLSSLQLAGNNLLEIDQLTLDHDDPEPISGPSTVGVAAISVQSNVAVETVFEPCSGAILELIPMAPVDDAIIRSRS